MNTTFTTLIEQCKPDAKKKPPLIEPAMREINKLNDYMKRIASVLKKGSPAAWRESLLEECQKADDQHLFLQAVIEDLVIS